MTEELRVSDGESRRLWDELGIALPALTVEQQSTLLSTFFTKSPDGLALIGPNLVILAANEIFAQRLGLPLSEMMGRQAEEIFPGWTEQIERICRGPLEAGKPFFAENYPFPFPGKPGDGVSHWTPAVSPVCGSTGTIEGWLFQLREATGPKRRELERERVLERARKSEASYRAIFDCANDGILVHDLESGEILDANQKTGTLYGYAPEEFRHLTVGDLSANEPPYTQKEALHRIRNAAGGEPQVFEWLAKDRTGRLFWVEVNLKRAAIGGKDRLLAIVRDITERKNAGEALRKAHDELERRVRERTAELAAVNGELRFEIAERRRVEEALKAERQRLFSVLDQVPAFLYLQAPDHSIRFANRRFRELFGDPKERTCYEIFHKRVEPCEKCSTLSVFRTLRARQSDDNPINGRTYQVYDYPFTDTDGSTLVLELGIDVTERRQAEEERQELLGELQRRVAELNAIIAAAADGLVIFGPNAEIVQINPAAEKMLGYQAADYARPLKERLAKVRAETYEGAPLLPEEAPVSKALRGETVQGQVVVLHPSPGRTYWVTGSAAPIRGNDEEVVGAVFTLTDITKVQELQEQLHSLLKNIDAQRRLSSSVIETAPVSMIVLRGPNFVCEMVNQAAQACAPGKPMLGKPFVEVWPDLAPQATPVFEHVLRTGKAWHQTDVPLRVRRTFTGSLEERSFTLGIAPLSKLGGEDQALVVAALETTEQVLARKKLEQLDRQKSEFLSLVAHELRTPLTALKGYSQTAMRRMKDLEGHEREIKALQIVNAQADRMSNLVSELLDISRIEQGRLELRMDTVDLGRLGKEVVHLLQVTTNRHDLRLSVDGPVEASGDPSRIEQVLFNLIHNAIKYSPYGGDVEIHIGNQSSRALVMVRDYGLGIPADKQPYLFDRFYQAHESGQAFSGLGIGLYISHEIVTRLGGKMWMESEEGKGSTFSFTLPLA